jgi:hypothetical protein
MNPYKQHPLSATGRKTVQVAKPGSSADCCVHHEPLSTAVQSSQLITAADDIQPQQ